MKRFSHFSKRLTRKAAGSILILASIVFGAAADDDTNIKAVTYATDVAPILYENCVGCHRPGQIGPMSLLSYSDVRPWAKSIKKSVAEKTMPPWPADPAFGHFKNAANLTPEKIATIISWIDQGAPQGDPSKTPPPPAFTKDNEWRMGKPDQVFTMLEDFKVEDDVEDHYQNFVIPSNLDGDKWITATELLPGAADVVHHILVFIAKAGKLSSEQLNSAVGNGDDPGNGGDIDPSLITGGLFAKYAPGANPEVWHEGRGRLMPAHCNIIFQVHYHKQAGAGTARVDKSRLAVKYADGPVEHPITTCWILNPTFEIPANADNVEAASVFRFADDGQIYALAPHMHLRGKDFTFEAKYPDGTTEVLLSVPRWNFNWQMSYILEEPKKVPRGTVIRATCHWDNSKNNPFNPDPNSSITWGEASTDEMMIGFMDYTYEERKTMQGQWGFPEGLNPLGFGGGPKTDEVREKFRERRMKKMEEAKKAREAKQAAKKAAAGSGE